MPEGRADGEVASCARCAELEAEIIHLRAQLAQLRAEHEELLRSVIDREYERPPHYR